ncbi:hypothetical protein [Plantactinospora endophytica]|uniref:LppX_LprAFG lipoprotein n=1 Tax=Plantactinospora endophytica TaxID=673535 RepID=A0ABQ4DU30_9ACTN|nr:hypothetical protein [Plantactinospora endophytica]GIG85965.1 hypothetical protein Pen02_09010 [Plantactinospora endophytica]
MRGRTLRSAARVLVLAAALGLPVAGCGITGAGSDLAPSGGAETSTPAQLSPVQKLADAAAKTNEGIITVVMRAPGITTDTRVDPAGKKATMNIVVGDGEDDSFRAELIQLDTDLYVRMPDLPGPSKKWMRGDVADLPAGSPLHLLRGGDHTGAADLANCVVSAERKGGHDYVGMLDLTRSRIVSRSVLAELGQRAGAVPFSARTSRGGDLFEIAIDVQSVLPTSGEIKYSYSRSDGVDAERPAPSEVTELPKSLVDRFEV